MAPQRQHHRRDRPLCSGLAPKPRIPAAGRWMLSDRGSPECAQTNPRVPAMLGAIRRASWVALGDTRVMRPQTPRRSCEGVHLWDRESLVLVAIHRGPGLPCSGMVDPQLWHLDVLPVRRPKPATTGRRTRNARQIPTVIVSTSVSDLTYLAPTTRWGYVRRAGTSAADRLPSAGLYAGRRNMPATGSCGHGQFWLLGESGLRRCP